MGAQLSRTQAQPSRMQCFLSTCTPRPAGSCKATSHHKPPDSHSRCSSEIERSHFKRSSPAYPACRRDQQRPTCLQLRKHRDHSAGSLLRDLFTLRRSEVWALGEFGFRVSVSAELQCLMHWVHEVHENHAVLCNVIAVHQWTPKSRRSDIQHLHPQRSPARDSSIAGLTSVLHVTRLSTMSMMPARQCTSPHPNGRQSVYPRPASL